MANDLQNYLQSVNAPDNTRAAAWDAATNAKDSNDLVTKLQGVQVPDNVKADLWEGRFGKGYPSIQPKPQANPSTPTDPDSFMGRMGQLGSAIGSTVGQFIHHPMDTAMQAMGLQELPGVGEAKQQILEQGAAAGLPAAQNAVQLQQYAAQPLIQPSQSKTFQKVFNPKSKNIISRGVTGGVKTAESFTSPESLYALGAIPLAPEEMGGLVSGAFAGQMAQGAAEGVQQTAAAIGQGNYGQAAEAGVGAVINAGMALGAGRHALGGEPVAGAPRPDSLPISPDELRPAANPHVAAAQVAGDARLSRVLGTLGPDTSPETTGPTVKGMRESEVADIQAARRQQPQTVAEPPAATGMTQNPTETPAAAPDRVAAAGTGISESTETAPTPQPPAQAQELDITQVPQTTEAAVEGSRPGTDTSAIEDKIRPLVGEVLQRRRLMAGDEVFHAADEAIRATRMDQDIHPDDKAVLSKILDTPVGDRLTPEQHQELLNMQGAKLPDTAKVLSYKDDTEAAYRMHVTNINDLEAMRDESLQNYMRDINDPNVPQEKKDALNKAFAEAQDGKSRFYLPTLEYPGMEDTPESHPEYPFGQKQLGSPVSKITLNNLSEIRGTQPRDLFESRSSEIQDNISQADRNRLKTLRDEAFGRGAAKAEAQPESIEAPKNRNLRDQPLTADQAEAVADHFGLDAKDVVGKSYNDIAAEQMPGYTPQVSSLRDIAGSETSEAAGMTVSNAERGEAYNEYNRLHRQLIRKAMDKRTRDLTSSLKSHIKEWQSQKGGAETLLDRQLKGLSDDARTLLPKELFGEQPKKYSRRTSDITTETSELKQPAPQATSAEASSAILGSGSGADKASKLLDRIGRDFPEALPETLKLAQMIKDKNLKGDAARRSFANGLSTFYSALKNDDDFAMKRAVDAINRVGEQGAVGRDISLLTPEQARGISAYAMDRFLVRHEALSDIGLKAYSDALHDPLIQKRLSESAPVEDSGPEAQDEYDSLRQRYQSLVDRSGPSTSIMFNMDTAFKRYADEGPAREQVKGILRSASGARIRDMAILKDQYHQADKVMESLSEADRFKFIDDMERGVYNQDSLPDTTKLQWTQADGMPPLDKVADLIRRGLDSARQEINETSGKFEFFLKNYIPHMYSNVGRAEAFAAHWWDAKKAQGGGNLEGTTAYFKQREYDFVSDSIAAGLQLRTTNPIRLSLMRIEQMKRFSMAHKMFNQLTGDSGTGVELIKEGDAVPVGYDKMNDRIFDKQAQGTGAYYAPKSVARVFNNFVSQGLAGKGVVPIVDLSLYDAMRGMGNLANQFQLSFSAFHGIETAMNSIFTAQSVAFQQAFNQHNFGRAALELLKSPAAPFTDLMNGSRVMLNYADPTKALDYADISNSIERVNGRIDVDPEFRLRSWEHLQENWSQAKNEFRQPQERLLAGAKAAMNLIGSSLQLMSYPLMNMWVPRLKMGAFMREARNVFEENVGQPDDVIQHELQKRWDSIDNRFGEVVYDNLFMSKVTRDILGMTMRSPGWNIGTFREGFGGAADLAKSVKNTAVNKQPFKLSTRSAYVMSMLASTAMFGAAYTYLHTGHAPEGPDYFFPRDGSTDAEGHANRVFPKNYTYDFISMAHDPMGTLWHKTSPTISTMNDIIQNRNYFGRQVRDPGDTPLAQARSVIAYAASTSMTPFTFQNKAESSLRGANSGWQSAFAIMPAPRYISLSPAERLAQRYYNDKNPQGMRTAEELEAKKAFVQLRNSYRAGDLKPEDVDAAVSGGKIKASDVPHIFQEAKPSLIRNTQGLSDFDQVHHVWQQASPEEKEKLLPILARKAQSIADPVKQQQVFQEIEDYSHTQK